MVKASISYVLRRERPEENLQHTEGQLSPIKEDTESWGYVVVVPKRHLNGGSVGNTTTIELERHYDRAASRRISLQQPSVTKVKTRSI